MLYQFKIELSDIDREIYRSLDFRVVQHPSESLAYLLTRVLAYALSYQEGIEFSPAGLGDPDAPALKVTGLHGNVDLWIEIGNASARKLHKATKAAKQVAVFTYKNAEALVVDIKKNAVHRAEEIQVFAFESSFLQALEEVLVKSNRWSVLHHQGRLDVGVGDASVSGEIRRVEIL